MKDDGSVDFRTLVEQARSGDQGAYTALYEATNQEVYRTVRAMVRSEETALDIQQDAYVFAFTHLDQLGDPGKFRAWLRAIAVNRTRSVLRKQTPLLFTELENEEGEGLPELADLSVEGSPELTLERRETSRLIQEILDSLSAGQRMLVAMYYYEQQPVGKIAEDLGVSPGTVKTQLSRSRKKIEAAVKRLEEKGVKLYGLSPLPFLLALLKKQEPAAEAGKAVLEGSLSRAGVAAEAAAVHVGRSFFQTVLGRVCLGLLTAAVIGGGVLGYRWARERLRMGDYQPPTTVETPEDLTTEPTEPAVTWDETPEDLTTESVITEPVTTEPEITEPEITEPGSTEAPTPVAPTPTPTAPPKPEPTEPTQSTEPEPTPPPVTSAPETTVLSHYDEVSSIEVDGWIHYHIHVIGDAVPTLYTDHPEILRIEAKGGYSGGFVGYRETGYFWYVEALDAGEAHLYCVLEGKTTLVSTVNVPLPPIEWHPSMPPVEDVIIDFEEETEP